MAHVIISNDDPRETYHPSSPQATFTIPFAFFDVADIRVIVDGDDAVYNASPATALEFSVAGNVADGGFQGGTFTLGVTVDDVDVIVYREVPSTRTTDFPYPSPTLNIKELNTQIDKVFAILQQFGRDIGRTVKLAVASTLEAINLPVPEAAKLLRWNASENGLENVDITGMGALSLPLSLAQGGTSASHPTVASLFNAIKQAATELATGVARVATQALANAGLNDTDFLTALKLWGVPFRGGWKNIVGANGGFEVWQRGAGGAASIAVPASSVAGVYTADRWYLFTSANQACTVSQQPGLTSRSRYCARIQRNNGQSGVAQMIFGFPLDLDEIMRLRGARPTIRFEARAGANWSPLNGTLTAFVSWGTGSAQKICTGYTAQANPLNAPVNLVPGAAAVTVSLVGAGLVGVNATQAEVFFVWTPTGAAGAADYVEIDNVDVRADEPVIDQFEFRPFNDELNACKAHFQKSFEYATAPAQGASVNGALFWPSVGTGAAVTSSPVYPFTPEMRGIPTITTFNTTSANAEVRNGTDGADCSSTAAASIRAKAFRVSTTGNAGLAVNEGLQVQWTADAGI
jgi:hypothetical protein